MERLERSIATLSSRNAHLLLGQAVATVYLKVESETIASQRQGFASRTAEFFILLR